MKRVDLTRCQHKIEVRALGECTLNEHHVAKLSFLFARVVLNSNARPHLHTQRKRARLAEQEHADCQLRRACEIDLHLGIWIAWQVVQYRLRRRSALAKEPCPPA